MSSIIEIPTIKLIYNIKSNFYNNKNLINATINPYKFNDFDDDYDGDDYEKYSKNPNKDDIDHQSNP